MPFGDRSVHAQLPTPDVSVPQAPQVGNHQHEKARRFWFCPSQRYNALCGNLELSQMFDSVTRLDYRAQQLGSCNVASQQHPAWKLYSFSVCVVTDMGDIVCVKTHYLLKAHVLTATSPLCAGQLLYQVLIWCFTPLCMHNHCLQHK